MSMNQTEEARKKGKKPWTVDSQILIKILFHKKKSVPSESILNQQLIAR